MWEYWQHQQLSGAAKTAGYVNSRAASVELQQQAAHHSLTQAGQFLYQQNTVDSTRLLLRASCGCKQCYRVVTIGAVRRSFARNGDPLKCPAHQMNYSNYSQYVTLFFEQLQYMGYAGVAVWDWHDVPAEPHMHWDCTLFLGGCAHRFEIDGPVHELRDGDRPLVDERKDAVVKNVPNLSLLRLSFHDRNAWAWKVLMYIAGRLQHFYNGVWATAWYTPFAGQGYGMVGLI